MSEVRIVHVIDSLGDGGAARALIANGRAWQRLTGGSNRIVSLLPASRSALGEARAMTAPVLEAPGPETLRHALADADIVQVHFFNTPALMQFLASPLPPCRLLVWCHVGGGTPPHLLTDAVAGLADCLLVTAPLSLALPQMQRLAATARPPRVVIGGADFDRLAGLQPQPHSGFNVGYIGTLDPVKIHPEFVAMSARVDVPGVRFLVCGGHDQALRKQAHACGAADRFEFRGFVRDIRPVLEVLDVFGYPLCAETYATSDQALQEAMFAGIPPVIFPHGGIRDMVRHNETGLVVDSPAAYADAIQHLAENPQERARIGRNARAHAEAHFSAARSAVLFDETYRALLGEPKRQRPGLANQLAVGGQGSALFLLSLSGALPEFAVSATDEDDAAAHAANQIIARSAPAVAAGVLQYRAHFRTDARLALWAGLIHSGAGHHARALIEFRHALAHGYDGTRLKDTIATSARALGASQEAIALAAGPVAAQ